MSFSIRSSEGNWSRLHSVWRTTSSWMGDWLQNLAEPHLPVGTIVMTIQAAIDSQIRARERERERESEDIWLCQGLIILKSRNPPRKPLDPENFSILQKSSVTVTWRGGDLDT